MRLTARVWLDAVVLVGLLLVAAPVRAELARPLATEPVSDPAVVEEARQRFDRGLQLFNAGDMMGARVEFERAFLLTGHPLALYNLALVHAGLGQAIEAVEALALLLREARGALGPARVQRAEQVHREQLLRVGSLLVTSNVRGATIQVDNVDAAATPAEPLRLTEGVHIVTAIAPGHEPRRVQVTVAGRAEQHVHLELLPAHAKVSHLRIATNVPDVSVRIGDSVVGHTPLLGPLTLAPATVLVELSRPGYASVRRAVTLLPGSVQDLAVDLVASEVGLAQGGVVQFAVSEPETVITIDDDARTDHRQGIRLPTGRHAVRAERVGFFAIQREILVQEGMQRVDLELRPTPEYLADYVRRAKRTRAASYATMAIGPALLVGGAAVLIWNVGPRREAEAAYDDEVESVETSVMGDCGGNQECEDRLNAYYDDYRTRIGIDAAGWVGVGVGGALLTTGILLRVLGKDPKRYATEHDVFARTSLSVGPRSVALSGRF